MRRSLCVCVHSHLHCFSQSLSSRESANHSPMKKKTGCGATVFFFFTPLSALTHKERQATSRRKHDCLSAPIINSLAQSKSDVWRGDEALIYVGWRRSCFCWANWPPGLISHKPSVVVHAGSWFEWHVGQIRVWWTQLEERSECLFKAQNQSCSFSCFALPDVSLASHDYAAYDWHTPLESQRRLQQQCSHTQIHTDTHTLLWKGIKKSL